MERMFIPLCTSPWCLAQPTGHVSVLTCVSLPSFFSSPFPPLPATQNLFAINPHVWITVPSPKGETPSANQLVQPHSTNTAEWECPHHTALIQPMCAGHSSLILPSSSKSSSFPSSSILFSSSTRLCFFAFKSHLLPSACVLAFRTKTSSYPICETLRNM